MFCPGQVQESARLLVAGVHLDEGVEATPQPGAGRSPARSGHLARAVSTIAKRVRTAISDAPPTVLFADSTGGNEGKAARLEREQREAEMDLLLAVVPD